jgi:plastocyanin
MRTHLPRAAAVLALIALPLAACGSDDDEPSGSDTTEAPDGDAIVVHGKDSLAFDPEELTAPAGEITIDLINDGSLAHTLVIEDHEAALKLTVAGSGDSDDGTITLEAGEYAFYCDVAGHRAGGMEGTLTVE